jgi:hypothetical protein
LLQQDFVALAVVVQHFLPLAHFFFLLPPSAMAIPVTKKAAIANNITFFITLVLFFFNIQRKVNHFIAFLQGRNVKVG